MPRAWNQTLQDRVARRTAIAEAHLADADNHMRGTSKEVLEEMNEIGRAAVHALLAITEGLFVVESRLEMLEESMKVASD